MSGVAAYDPEVLPPWPVRAGFLLYCACTALVILGLTAYTHQLDDIKIPFLLIGGAAMFVAWAGLLLAGLVELPPRIVWIAYGVYIAVCVASTITARDFAHWIGWQSTAMYVSALGFVLLGSAVIQTKKMAERALKFWVVITLVTTGFGLLHYAGFMEPFYKFLYPRGAPLDEDRLHDLVKTFRDNRSMLSTILNVQFFGNFLTMTLPVTAACTMFVFHNLRRRIAENEPGYLVGISVAWMVASGLALVFALTCVFTTFAKSAILILPVLLVLFFGAAFWFAGLRRIPHLWLMVACGAIMTATVLFFTWGDLRAQIKDLDESLGPRKAIWSGALAIFRDNPVLGGGPGSFRILFPEYRNPEYHLMRISNLTIYAHNWVLDLLSDTGVLGAAAYLTFLGSIFGLGYLALRRCPDMTIRVAVIGCLVGVVSILAGSMTTPMTRWPVGVGSLHAMLGTALGVALLGLRAPGGGEPSRRARGNGAAGIASVRTYPMIAKGLLAASAIFLLWITPTSIRAFRAAYYHNEGLKLSEFPDSFFGASGQAEDPMVIDYLQKAVAHLRQSIALDPTRMTTYYKLANVENRLGRIDTALATYKALQKYGPDYSEVHYNLAILYYNSARVAQASSKGGEKGDAILTLMRRAVEEGDHSARLSRKISVVYFQGSLHSMLAQQLAQGTGESRAAYLRAGEIFQSVADLRVATVIQEPGQKEREEIERLASLKSAIEMFELAGDYAKAARAAERHLALSPGGAAPIQNAVRLYLLAKEETEAMRVIDASLAENPLGADMILLKMRVYRETGKAREAFEEGHYLLALDAGLRQKGVSLLPAEREGALRAELASLKEALQKETP